MIIDTSFIQEMYEAEHIKDYSTLMTYMRQFSKQYYDSMNILCQEHHNLPLFECETKDGAEVIWLPVTIHFLAHFYRAEQQSLMNFPGASDYAIGNYTEAFCILKKYPKLQCLFPSAWQRCEEAYVKWYKPHTYEAAFGTRKALIIKRKIAIAMSNLDAIIISKRNESISKYAKHRPQSHNDAIAKAKRKMIVCITTNKFYNSALDASLDTKISIASIRKCCLGKIQSVKKHSFEYID